MNVKRITLIGYKEFQDHLTSWRFLALLFLMLTITGVYVFKDIGNYFNGLESYNNHPGFSLCGIPKAMNIFSGIASGIGGSSVFGSIIAIALGFDLITKERETGSIKALLSVPLYRDEVINGKALGGIIAIIFAVTAVFVLTLGIMLVYSIVPGLDELGFIFVFWFVTILYLSGIFVMSVMISSFSKTSGMSFIYSLLLLLLLTSVIYSTGQFAVNTVMGPKPSINADNMEIDDYYEQATAYNQRKMEFTSLVRCVSINSNYRKVAGALTEPEQSLKRRSGNPHDPDSPDPKLFDLLGGLWSYILFLIVYPAIFFGIAYVRFMRMDLR